MRDDPNFTAPTSGARVASYRGERLLDLAIAIPALVITGPLVLAALTAVRIRLGSPVLYRQTRLGQHGRPFEILKVRTMSNDRDHNGQLLPDGQRLGRLGRTLRRASLDELPNSGTSFAARCRSLGPARFPPPTSSATPATRPDEWTSRRA